MCSDKIATLAADRTSGASEILRRAIDILHDARARGDTAGIARAVVRAQPGMAPIWNAVLAALAEQRTPGAFDAFVERAARAPAALTRTALDFFRAHPPDHVVTLSYSGTVLAVLHALHHERPLQVTCSEGRPAMEGRTMAARLAAAGIAVTLTTDAAVNVALDSADAVLVGADAVTADWFLNKTGTRMLAAAATAERVPMYVAATRDKFVSSSLASRLTVRHAAPGEVWDDAPPGVTVRNFYFERTPHASITAVVTEDGMLDPARGRSACDALDGAETVELLHLLVPPDAS